MVKRMSKQNFMIVSARPSVTHERVLNIIDEYREDRVQTNACFTNLLRAEL